MKFHKQLFRHRPAEGSIGDCHRTAIACLLDLEPHEVPHFAEQTWNADTDAWDRAWKDWLLSKGYRAAGVAFTVAALDELMKIMAVCAPGIFYLLGGTSKNGTAHTVIGCGGEIVHDPAIDDSGIAGPLQPEGCYTVHYLIPEQFCVRAAA